MKTRKAILYSLLLPQTLGQLILFLFFRKESAALTITYSFSIFFASLIGLIFGVIISVLLKNPWKERWFYASGQILAFALLLVFILKKNSSTENQKQSPEGTASNVFNPDSLYEGSNPVKLAITKLESKFERPDSIRLTYINLQRRDTMVSGNPSHVYMVYLTYNTTEKDSLFSKIIVLNDSCYFQKLNADARYDEQLQQVQSRFAR